MGFGERQKRPSDGGMMRAEKIGKASAVVLLGCSNEGVKNSVFSRDVLLSWFSALIGRAAKGKCVLGGALNESKGQEVGYCNDCS